MNLEEKLIQKKKAIETAKSKKDQAQGALKSLQERIQKELDINDFKELPDEITSLSKQIDKEQTALDTAFNALEEKWPI